MKNLEKNQQLNKHGTFILRAAILELLNQKTTWPNIMKKPLVLTLFVCLVGFPYAAQALEEGWYLSPSASYVIADHNRPKDNGWGAGVSLGKKIDPTWNIEVGGRYIQMNNVHDELASVGVDILRFVSRNPSLSPFVVVGAGYAREENRVDARHNFMANAGIGLFTQIGRSLDFRAEARYHWHSNEGNVYGADQLGDWLINVGFNYALGSQ